MVSILIAWVVSALAILAAAYVLPGVHVSGFITALVAAIVLGIINAFLEPILLFLALPINLLTLGLFTFVVNAVIILISASIVPGFKVDGFWWALAFSVVLSIIISFLHKLNI